MKGNLLISILILLSVTIVELILLTGCEENGNDNSSLVTDVDGNHYHIVTIGTQEWMKENLKTTKYQTGDPIDEVTDSIQWASSTTGIYCSFKNDVKNSATYGLLYNWYAVNDSRSIAPTGWHVASDADWRTLVDYLGGDSTGGGKLKEAGTKHWYSPNTGATNETGFTALPGGYRFSNGEFRDFTSYGAWWSSSLFAGSGAWRWSMLYNSSGVDRAVRNYTYGFSVRCVRYNSLAGDIPIVTTNDVSSVSFTTATGGGNITSDGGAPIIARGVCWSTGRYPTIADFKTSDGSGTGSFTSNIGGLTTNKTYYVRAFATNSNGTGYGKILSFLAQGVPTGTVTDIDGNIYITVTIKTQVWMAENLKTTKFKNGTTIPKITDAATWSSLTTPGYCWNYFEDYNKEPYRGLYNWYAVNSGNLCPSGWHVPTDTEWSVLINYLDGADVASGKLKETGTTHWFNPNTGATNETGFTALPGGWCLNVGIFASPVEFYGKWWSSTESSTSGAWYYEMNYYTTSVTRAGFSKKSGIAVRCIKGS